MQQAFFKPIGFEWEIQKHSGRQKAMQNQCNARCALLQRGQPAYFGTTLFINS